MQCEPRLLLSVLPLYDALHVPGMWGQCLYRHLGRNVMSGAVYAADGGGKADQARIRH